MPRIPQGVIDDLSGYTYLGLDGPANPEDDYYEMDTPAGVVTIWGVGLVSIGPVTAAEQGWMANLANNSDLSTFPGYWVSLGFSIPVQQDPTIEIWYPGAWIGRYVVNDQHQIEYLGHVLVDEQGIFGADSWSIDGLTSTTSGPDFYWSDLHVTNGTDASETLNGTSGPDTLNGLGGDDTLNGGDGADALYGGPGNDHLIGGPGIDRLFGGDGNDRLEPGVEQISQSFFSMHQAADSMIDGGAGFDTLVLDYSQSAGSVVVVADQLLSSPGITNVEAVDITGSPFTDSLSGSSSADKLFGGGGFDVLRGGAGNDWLDAGAPGPSSVTSMSAGGDSIANALPLDGLFTAGAGIPSVTLSITEPAAIITQLWGIEQHTPKVFSFTVAQAGTEGFIDWTLGDYGTGGGPTFGFVVTDENGVQIPTSYDSTVPMVFPHAGTYYLQVLFQTTTWDYTTLDVALSLEGANVLTSNMLYGGTGDDTYVVYSPSDQVIENPGEGTDTVRSSASFTLPDNVEDLILTGSPAINGTGNDLANVINGNDGANVITGGGGADILSGGAGADIFRFIALSDSAPGGADLIGNFTSTGKFAKGLGDKIDLSAIDANTSKAGDQAFTFVHKFTGHAGQLYGSYDAQAQVTHVYLDVNGDGVADMIIDLAGQVKLTAADFIL